MTCLEAERDRATVLARYGCYPDRGRRWMSRWIFRKVNGQWLGAESIRRRVVDPDTGTGFEDFRTMPVASQLVSPTALAELRNRDTPAIRDDQGARSVVDKRAEG